jgi:hypothetical protein
MIFKIVISLRKLGSIVTTIIFQNFDNERIRIFKKIMFCICNVIPLVGTMESLEEDKDSFPMNFAKNFLLNFLFLGEALCESIFALNT